MKIKNGKDLTFQQTSKRFGIGIRTLFRWQRNIRPKLTRNKPATKVNMDKLSKDVAKNPDAYLSERAEHFKVSVSCIFYALKRLDISYKKNSVSSEGG